MSIECKHGYLARVCDRCEMEEELEKLRAFVRAWDAAENVLPGNADYPAFRYTVRLARDAIGYVPTDKQLREKALDELAELSQKLDMGY